VSLLVFDVDGGIAAKLGRARLAGSGRMYYCRLLHLFLTCVNWEQSRGVMWNGPWDCDGAGFFAEEGAREGDESTLFPA
jgi:hypothetical protein